MRGGQGGPQVGRAPEEPANVRHWLSDGVKAEAQGQKPAFLPAKGLTAALAFICRRAPFSV